MDIDLVEKANLVIECDRFEDSRSFHDVFGRFLSELESGKQESKSGELTNWCTWQNARSENEKQDIGKIFLALAKGYGDKMQSLDLLEMVDGSPRAAVQLVAHCVQLVPERRKGHQDVAHCLYNLSRLVRGIGFASTAFREELDDEHVSIARRSKALANHLRDVYSAVFQSDIITLMGTRLSEMYTSNTFDASRQLHFALTSFFELTRSTLQSTSTFPQAEKYGKTFSNSLSSSLPYLWKTLVDGPTKKWCSEKRHKVALGLQLSSTFACFQPQRAATVLDSNLSLLPADIVLEMFKHEALLEDVDVFDSLVRFAVNTGCCVACRNPGTESEEEGQHLLASRCRERFHTFWTSRQKARLFRAEVTQRLNSGYWRMVNPMNMAHVNSLDFLFHGIDVTESEENVDEEMIQLAMDEAKIHM